MTTKDVEINGQKFTIKRMTIKDRSDFSKFLLSHKDDYELMLEQVYMIENFCLEPKFSHEQILDMDSELGDLLYLEITKFNQTNKDFLLGLKNLQSQESLQSPTKQ